MAEKTYSIRIEEISDNGRRGVDYAVITGSQYADIMAIASVKADEYKSMNLEELFFG